MYTYQGCTGRRIPGYIHPPWYPGYIARRPLCASSLSPKEAERLSAQRLLLLPWEAERLSAQRLLLLS